MEFYRQPSGADGFMSICKGCHRANVRANYQNNRERYQEYERSRASLPHRVQLRKEYARTPEGLAAGNRGKRAYTERNPIKRAASLKVGNAIRTGRLARQPCEVCGNAPAQGHHDDYGKPLVVRWLCTTHHAEWHKHNDPIVPEQEAAA